MSFKRWLPLLFVLHGALVYAQSEELPADELLEFLGSYESLDGKWIDPNDFEVPFTDAQVAEQGGNKDE